MRDTTDGYVQMGIIPWNAPGMKATGTGNSSRPFPRAENLKILNFQLIMQNPSAGII
jgi:hypothetical protein